MDSDEISEPNRQKQKERKERKGKIAKAQTKNHKQDKPITTGNYKAEHEETRNNKKRNVLKK